MKITRKLYTRNTFAEFGCNVVVTDNSGNILILCEDSRSIEISKTNRSSTTCHYRWYHFDISCRYYFRLFLASWATDVRQIGTQSVNLDNPDIMDDIIVFWLHTNSYSINYWIWFDIGKADSGETQCLRYTFNWPYVCRIWSNIGSNIMYLVI